jgi:sugar (pentulose or hexulose) kinase
VLSLGTSATVFAYSRTPVLDPAGLIAPFCDSTGGYLPLLCVMNATGVLLEVARAFPGETLESLTAAAARVERGAEELLFVPYLFGERVPDLPTASGTLLGLRPGLLTPGHLFRAALEGVALNLAWGVARLRALGVPCTRVRVVGGGAKNALWLSILCEALEAELERLAEDESGALGAALQAAWMVRGGSLDELVQACVRPSGPALVPAPAGVAFYRTAGERFRAAVEALHPR